MSVIKDGLPSDRIRETIRRLGLVVIGVFVFYRMAMVVFLPLRDLLYYVHDDFCYYLQIGSNVARGNGFTFDGLHRTNGFHPLWQLVCVLPHLLGLGPEVALRLMLVTGCLLLLVSALLFRRMLRRHFGEAAALFGLLPLFWPLILNNYLSGMEMMLTLPLILLTLDYAERRGLFRLEASRRAEWLVGVLLALTFLSRLDMAFLILTSFVFLAAAYLGRGAGRGRGWGDFFRRALRLFLPTAAALGAYLLWNLTAFERLGPISGSLKSSFPNPGFYWYNLLHFREVGVAALVGMIWLIVRRRRLPQGVAILAWSFALFSLHNLLFMRWTVLFYYIVALGVPVLLFSLGDFAASVAARRRWSLYGILILAAVAVVGGNVFSFTRRGGGFTSTCYDAACWVRENTPSDAVFAMSDCGVFGYFSLRSTINLDGLVNNEEYQRVLSDGRLGEYLTANGVDYFVDHAVTPERLDTFTKYLPSRLYGGACLLDVQGAPRIFTSRPYGYLFHETIYHTVVYDIRDPGDYLVDEVQ